MSLKETGCSIKETIEKQLNNVETFISEMLEDLKIEMAEQRHIDYTANLSAFEEKWNKIGEKVHTAEQYIGKISPSLEQEIEEQFQADYMSAVAEFRRKWKSEIEQAA